MLDKNLFDSTMDILTEKVEGSMDLPKGLVSHEELKGIVQTALIGAVGESILRHSENGEKDMKQQLKAEKVSEFPFNFKLHMARPKEEAKKLYIVGIYLKIEGKAFSGFLPKFIYEDKNQAVEKLSKLSEIDDRVTMIITHVGKEIMPFQM